MTDHEDFADSRFAPLDDVRAGLQALKDEMNKPPEPWPFGYNKNGIPITLIPPSLYDAALKQNPDADMSMYRRHELLKVGEMQVTHLTGQLLPGWDVPKSIGVDHGAPEGDSTGLIVSERGEMQGMVIHKSRSVGPSVMMMHMPRSLNIYMRPNYPWFHTSGYAAGRTALTPAPRPRTTLARAIDTMLAAPTLTNQA